MAQNKNVNWQGVLNQKL